MKLWQSKHGTKCKISQQDLRAISEEIAQKYTPTPDTIHAPPTLVLMSVDPSHLYVYWNLSSHEIDRLKMTRQKQLTLRVYSIPELSSEASYSAQLSFDITVDGKTNQQQISLPMAATAYSAVIGEIQSDNSFHPLVAAADIISVPRATPHDSPPISPLTPLLKKQVASQIHQKSLLYDTFVLEDFNNSGYDLIVYESISNAPPLLFESLKTAILNKQKNNFNTNNSALGRLLE